jgi:hypothetical protein
MRFIRFILLDTCCAMRGRQTVWPFFSTPSQPPLALSDSTSALVLDTNIPGPSPTSLLWRRNLPALWAFPPRLIRHPGIYDWLQLLVEFCAVESDLFDQGKRVGRVDRVGAVPSHRVWCVSAGCVVRYARPGRKRVLTDSLSWAYDLHDNPDGISYSSR